MKKLTLPLFIATFIFIGTAKAQVISGPADDFEVWSPDVANGSAMDPNNGGGGAGWQCFNVLSGAFTGSSPVSVFEENTIVHSGSHSCKIVSVVLTPTSYNYVKSFTRDTVGALVSGTVVTNPSPAFKLGVPHSSRLTSLTFYYQYFPKVNVKPDTAFCAIVLTHHSGGVTHTLGAGVLKMDSTGHNWVMGTVPVIYDSASGNPDTLSVLFSSSSNYKPIPGSILYIDGVTLLGENSINAPIAHVDVYPNPVSTEVNFRISALNGDEGYSIEVYDITGKKLNAYPVKNNLASINTSTYNSGLYFYQLYDKNGAQMKIGKFSVVK